MNIGFLGLGKLGLPVAVAIESCGHLVCGYDTSKDVQTIISSKKIPYKEELAQEYLEKSNIKFLTLQKIVKFSEIIFVSIQTPHNPQYEGITRIPEIRADFDYSYLKEGIAALSKKIEEYGKDKIVIIISTVLPGTIRRDIKPLLGGHTKLCYNPFFIAMGTTIKNFLDPEFVLLGVDDDQAAKKIESFYATIHQSPFFKTTIENAELIKVLYNSFVSMKLAFANTIMEICHKTPNSNVDDVTNALKMANKRIISDSYLEGGMGDGGGCHPRDNIALSYLARKLDLSYDWFENIMLQRENQTDWLADLIIKYAAGKPILILGKSFKAESNITTGSPSILLKNILIEKNHIVNMWDPLIDGAYPDCGDKPLLYFIGTKHAEFQSFPFTTNSIILDPWRYIQKRDGIKVIGIGDSLYE